MTEDERLARGIQRRLVAHAKAIGAEPNVVLSRFAVERWLYRLSRSAHQERFVLKGALLMLVWLGETFRPTRDADLLGFGDFSDAELRSTFEDICHTGVEPDGMTYVAETIRIADIRFDDAYGGRRLTMDGRLGSVRLPVQVDIGIGDAAVPEPAWLDYPSLLEMPRARLRAYAPETVFAEKLHAICMLGMRNSRMKDYFDLHALLAGRSLDADTLRQAIGATFERRRTAVPSDWPVGLTNAFANDPDKARQWTAFLLRNRLDGARMLGDVVNELRSGLSGLLGSLDRTTV